MGRWFEPTPDQEASWKAWVAERPPVVRAMAERFPPWDIFLLKTTGQRVTILSFSEGGTMTVTVSGQFNFVLSERNVFGIDPNDLEPCDVPTADQPTGSMLTQDAVEANIDVLRFWARPDLFEMGPDGKAQRKSP